MDLTDVFVAFFGTLGVTIPAWLSYRAIQKRRRGGGDPEPEQEAALVLDPQREHVDYLRQQVEDLQRQLRECYVKRNEAVERVARLEERLRARRREDS